MNQKASKTERTVDAILAHIINNHLGVGDKLPSEDELVSMLGVSRLCVREALLGLKFLGLLQSNTRGGTRLSKVDFRVLNRIIGFQISLLNYSFRQLLEARLTLELGALDMLSGKLGAERLARLRKLAMTAVADDDLSSRARLDCAFHQELLRLCGNDILLSFSQLLEVFFVKYIERVPSATADPSDLGDSEHLALLEALEDGNTELARGLLRKHLGRYIRLAAEDAQ